jgi:hypothetical protein
VGAPARMVTDCPGLETPGGPGDVSPPGPPITGLAGQKLRNKMGSIAPVVSILNVVYGCPAVHVGWLR